MNRLQRFWAYGAAGVLSEVLTTSIKSPMRDKNYRLTAHTYLWMVPIYGSAAILFEPAHNALRSKPWWARGLAWTAGIFAVEAASGAAIKKVAGEVPWDYARPRGQMKEPVHYKGLVRPAYAPQWFLVGMAMEKLHDTLVPRESE
jgi:hypothetical protein